MAHARQFLINVRFPSDALMTASTSRVALPVIVLAAAVGIGLARPAPLTLKDQEQGRLDQAAPIPGRETTVRQTFAAAHNGLSAVELLAVVYSGASVTDTLTLRLLDAWGSHVIAAQDFAGVAHNAPLRLSFPPIPDSAGKSYTLALEGSLNNKMTVWAYSLDGYALGQLSVNGAPASGDLRFSTTYTYLWADVARDAVKYLGRLGALALPLWAILFAPGLLLIQWAGYPNPAAWVKWGIALALSLSLLPLAWLWITAAGLWWSKWTLGPIYILIGLAAVWLSFSQALTTGWLRHRLSVSAHDLLVALVLLLSMLARLLAIHDLSFPAWVDSPHHFTITRLLAESGRVPASYNPLLPVDQFSYHFGFHALAATIHWLTGLSLVDTFLFGGQLLNGLTPLVAYTFVVLVSRRPRAGLVAAFFVGLVSLFPAYYLSWGRYTQLTGLLVLAPLLGGVWSLVAPTSDGESVAAFRRKAVVIGLLAAGLLLTHYRLLAFFAVFVLVALALGRRGGWKIILMAAVIGALLASPWLARLSAVNVLPLLNASGSLAASEDYNRFPVEYFQRELEKGWMTLALLAGVWGVIRRERTVWLVAGWVATTFALLNIGPGTWLVNNNSWAITLFLPGAFALGWGADEGLAWAGKAIGDLFGGRQPDLARSPLAAEDPALPAHSRAAWARGLLGCVILALATGLAVYAGVKGALNQMSVSNPATILATAQDALALQWVDEHVSSDAVFVVNGWLWLNRIWASPDAGSWIWPLTGRRTTLPPLDYTNQQGWREEVRAFNETMAKVQDAGAPETLALLRAAGATHVFIGARGGNLKPEMFAGNPNYHLLYTNGAAWVFEVAEGGGP